jgi:hypothetical protein
MLLELSKEYFLSEVEEVIYLHELDSSGCRRARRFEECGNMDQLSLISRTIKAPWVGLLSCPFMMNEIFLYVCPKYCMENTFAKIHFWFI